MTRRTSQATETAKRAVIYARVSSPEQAKDEIKIDGQVRACYEFCAKRGFQVVAEPFIDEGITGYTFKRPAFEQMIALAESKPRPFEFIVVWKLNRIGRSFDAPGVDKRLSDRGIEIIDTTQDFGEGRGSRLFKSLTYLVAADYRENLSEDVTRGQRAAVEAGRHGTGGRPPFGYLLDYEGNGRKTRRRYMPNPEEAEIAKEIFQRYDRGCSIRSIVIWLNESNVPTAAIRDGKNPRGRTHGLWLHGTVWRILKNPVYTGAYVYGRRETWIDENARYLERRRPESEQLVIEGAHEALVSKELFSRVRARLESNERSQARPGKPQHFLLRVGKCAVCGGSLQHESNGRHYYFTCRNRRRLKHDRFNQCRGTIRADYVEDYLTEFITKLHTASKRNEYIAKRVDAYNERASRVAKNLGLERLDRVIAKHEREVANMLSFIAGGESSAVRERLAMAESQLESARQRRAALEAKIKEHTRELDPRKVFKDLRDLYLSLRRLGRESFVAALPRVIASVAIDFTSDDVDDMVHIRPHFDEKNLAELEDSVLHDVTIASESAQFLKWIVQKHA